MDAAEQRLVRIEAKIDDLIELTATTAARCADCRPIVLGDAAHAPIADRLGTVETDVAVLRVRRDIAARAAWLLLGVVGTWLATVGASWAATRLGL